MLKGANFEGPQFRRCGANAGVFGVKGEMRSALVFEFDLGAREGATGRGVKGENLVGLAEQGQGVVDGRFLSRRSRLLFETDGVFGGEFDLDESVPLFQGDFDFGMAVGMGALREGGGAEQAHREDWPKVLGEFHFHLLIWARRRLGWVSPCAYALFPASS